ncbi:hypothetical protein [Flavobacterium sp.]
MSTKNKLGIWMDHSAAHLIPFTGKDDALEIMTITNFFGHEEKEEALSRSENLMHNKRQQQLGAFYKDIENEVILYSDVILFGPTDAKTELLNVLRADLRFEKIKLEAMGSDNMTENQKKAFVRDYFTK